MLIDLHTEWSKRQRVYVHEYKNSSITLSYGDLYSIVCVEHYGNASLNFESYKLKGYYLIFLCPEEILEIEACTQSKVITIPTGFKITENESFIHTFGNVQKCCRIGIMDFLKINLVYNELQQIAYNESCKLQNVLDIILSTCRLILTKSTNKNEFVLVYKFICLVHEYYKMHHEMSFYSKKLIMRSKYITEKFNQLGIPPPHEFIKRRILTEAKRQLIYSNKTIKTICFDIGFNDPAYFARFFKKNTGMTAMAFKKRYRRSYEKRKNVQ